MSIGQLLNTIISIIIMMVSARVLSMQDLATYRQSLLIFQVATPFIGLGMGSALLYFLPVEPNRRRSLLIESLFVCFFSGVVISFIIFLGAGDVIANSFENSALNSSLYLIAILMLFAGPNIIISPFLIVQNKVNILSTYQVGMNFLVGLSVIVACIYSENPILMLEVRVLLLILGALLAIKIMLSSVSGLPVRVSLTSCRSLINYGLPLSMSMCIGMLSLQLDKLIVSAKTTPELFVIYSNGAIEIPLIGIITTSICLVMIVPFRKAFSDVDLKHCIILYRQVSEKISFILLPVMFYFALVATPFIIIMYSDKYLDSVFPFLLYLLIIPSRTLLQGAMAAVGKGRILLRNSIISLISNGVLTYFFVNEFGYYGAIISTIIVLYCWDVLISIKELSSSLKCKMMDLYPINAFFKIFTCAILASIPTYVFLNHNAEKSAIIQLLIAGFIYFPLYLILGMKLNLFSKEILHFINENFSKVKSKLIAIL